MDQKKRVMVLVGVLIAAAVVAIIFIPRASHEEKPPPNAPGYYTGPMKNKSGRDEYSTEDNKIVPKPADASTTASVPGGAKPEGKGSGGGANTE